MKPKAKTKTTTKSPAAARHIGDRVLLTCVLALAVAGLFTAMFNLARWSLNSRANLRLKEEIIKEAVSDDPATPDEGPAIDFETLQSENPDTVAYLRLPSLNINYPVVKTSDNDYYLDHNFRKEVNITGWIFADYRNRFDGSDKNLIIYGHNSYDDQMFSLLSRTQDPAWQDAPENLIISLATPENLDQKYQIFSTYTFEPEDYYLTTDFSSDAAFATFLATISARSTRDFAPDLASVSSVLTLSSCTPDGDRRVVVHAYPLSD